MILPAKDFHAYNFLNRLTNVLDHGNDAAAYNFNGVGNLLTMRYGIMATNAYQYDSLNRLTNLACTPVSGTVASFYYQLGLTGNRTNLIESVNGFKRTNSWSYDSLYGLVNEIIKTNGGSSSLGYSYDSVGNRLGRTIAGSNLNLTNQTFTFNTNDWLNMDKYDSNGNTTNASGNAYQYDALNHVTNVNNTVFITYDGDGNRVSKKIGGTTTYYLLDDRNPSGYAQVLEEWTSTGTPVLSRVYNYGLSLISQRQPNVSTNYFVYDGHGSTRVLLDAGGNVVNTFAYDAYGTLIASSASPQTAYLYCGQQLDADLGLYYNRARYLNPNTGRFWTMDSYAGNNEDPLSLHKYLYCKDNPIMGLDPSGHDWDLTTQLSSISIRNVLIGLAITLPLTYVGVELANMYGGHAPDPVTQKPKLDRVLSFLNSVTNWSKSVQPYKTIAVGAHYRVYEDSDGAKNWAETRPYGQLFIHTIYLNERSFQLNDQFLASQLIHEAVHTTQWGVTEKQDEPPAYDIQSDALRTMGISGSIYSSDVQKFFTEKQDENWATQVADNMEEFKIQNPALYRQAP